MKISQFLGEILSDKGMCKMKLNLKEKKLFQGVEETYAKQKGQHVPSATPETKLCQFILSDFLLVRRS